MMRDVIKLVEDDSSRRVLLRYLYECAEIELSEFCVIITQAETELGGNMYSVADQFRAEGKAEGMERGMATGIEKGKAEGVDRTLSALISLKKGCSIEKVAKSTGLSLDIVHKLSHSIVGVPEEIV